MKLGVLLSGRGSNFVAIADAIADGSLEGCSIAVVLSNLPDAGGLAIARERGIEAIAISGKGIPREEHEAKMIATLLEHEVDLVCLAGYMRILTPQFIRAFQNRILNIHPSLLPSFPGTHAQQQAFEYGAKIAGCTVHFVDEEVDHGVIVLQRAVAVEDTDTAETLAERILHEEHAAYPEALRRVLSGAYTVEGRRYIARS
ncbi:phosphoribosylglycinamide formyltransferase [Terriglobus saanensis]|uniref:Phosphoribosylglycinamide formyltransferase n=1 Tax=Terriglobus saanensis (strain ATCC BAA-1853 / DSM 23119 / SP1PR4) TaxID=401053 RepID=E8V364_TERSS|nr:phosphoribosylglycinamide formyltransferase [Terriglobus saanensis]ADV81339.1 phosphoribosylglycinamide formyltransferase [Terriglobus saanensis SP1PR4]